jgi:outer membrane protein assembly factor BamB
VNGTVWIQAGSTLALDGASGKLLWRADLGGAVQSVPVLTETTVYLVGMDGEVYALE